MRDPWMGSPSSDAQWAACRAHLKRAIDKLLPVRAEQQRRWAAAQADYDDLAWELSKLEKRVDDAREAVRQEYRENEVFPPSDSVEDWLKLLDYEPENVVKVTSVHPQVEKTQEARSGKVI